MNSPRNEIIWATVIPYSVFSVTLLICVPRLRRLEAATLRHERLPQVTPRFTTVEEAVTYMRGHAEYADLLRDAYLCEDVQKNAQRFAESAEFDEIVRLLGRRLDRADLLDVGAGNGVASYAFARAGASRVFALEPDPSSEVGRGAIEAVTRGLPVEILDGYGESIPLADESVDIVYARQVLHHAGDLGRLARECARVLRRGGLFIAAREHVVDDAEQLRAHLAAHPVHQLVGHEHAFPLSEYLSAISSAGLQLERTIGPWDSVVNAFPAVHSNEELVALPRTLLETKFGFLGQLAAGMPGVTQLVWKRLRRPVPGRMYTFAASKPRGFEDT